MAAFRQACWGSRAMGEEELLYRVALGLGDSLGPELQERLQELLDVAVSRRIVARQGDLFVGVTPKFARYDDDFLLGLLRTFLPEDVELDRRSLTRTVATWLGYSQVTAAMRDRMEEVFEEGIRRGVLGWHGGRICHLSP